MVTLLEVRSAENLSVTAIIPTFRSEKVVLRALQSVLDQTRSVDEIIVVDDASDDRTVEVLNEFASKHRQIRVIVNQQNVGPGQSRNIGWANAKGSLIAFLDADDTWHPKKIETQVEWLDQNPHEVICGTQHRLFDRPNRSRSEDVVSKFNLSDLLTKNRFSTPSVMLRRNIELRFDQNLRLSEDYLLWMEIASQYGRVCRLNLQLTILHKPIYGAAGLSSKVMPMYIGELNALRILRKKNRITTQVYLWSNVWSTIKLFRRLPSSAYRNIKWRLNVA